MGAVGESREFLFAECARQRTDPGPGLIGQIIREHGDEISDFDLGGLADGAFTGGLETSASMLALGTVVLLGRPELYAGLVTDPASVTPVVEELLRHLSVVQVAFPRFTKAETTVAGHRIRKGSCVLVHLPAVDRDPRAFPVGDGLDPSRASASHLAFGYGFHRCVGAELARMELRAAYPALARRFPDLSPRGAGRRPALPRQVDRLRRRVGAGPPPPLTASRPDAPGRRPPWDGGPRGLARGQTSSDLDLVGGLERRRLVARGRSCWATRSCRRRRG